MTNEIKIFALSTCPYCKKTKRFLSEKGIDYEAVDVDLLTSSEQDDVLEEIEKLTGKRSFPVVIIGDEVIVGHNEDKLRQVLGL
ncbi:MAG: glutaredoxin family protein [Thermoplasmata archaeon]|nr:glutaredoxin family protein [Thermoplasmata archaeon]